MQFVSFFFFNIASLGLPSVYFVRTIICKNIYPFMNHSNPNDLDHLPESRRRCKAEAQSSYFESIACAFARDGP